MSVLVDVLDCFLHRCSFDTANLQQKTIRCTHFVNYLIDKLFTLIDSASSYSTRMRIFVQVDSFNLIVVFVLRRWGNLPSFFVPGGSVRQNHGWCTEFVDSPPPQAGSELNVYGLQKTKKGHLAKKHRCPVLYCS